MRTYDNPFFSFSLNIAYLYGYFNLLYRHDCFRQVSAYVGDEASC